MSVGHQLVAVTIDQQLKYIISTTLTKTFETLQWNRINDFLKNDIELLIDMIYSYLSFSPESLLRFLSSAWPSLFDNSSEILSIGQKSTPCTPGMRVLGLTWEERGSSLLYLTSLLGYSLLTQLRKLSLIEGWRIEEGVSSGDISSETEIHAQQQQRRRKKYLYEIIKYLLTIMKCGSILNYIFFFITGEYPTLAYRIAGFKMKCQDDEEPKFKLSQLNLENRKMLWYTMIGLVTALSISFDWQYYRNYLYFYIYSIIKQIKTFSSYYQSYQRRWWKAVTQCFTRFVRNNSSENIMAEDVESSDLQSEEREESKGTELILADQMVCSICELPSPQNPYVANCGHHYCYFCYYEYLPPSLVPEKKNRNKKKFKRRRSTRQRRSSSLPRENSTEAMEQITFLSSSFPSSNNTANNSEDDIDEKDEEQVFYCPICYQQVRQCVPWKAISEIEL